MITLCGFTLRPSRLKIFRQSTIRVTEHAKMCAPCIKIILPVRQIAILVTYGVVS